MADLEHVTLTVPADVLREARHLAVDRGMSLSHFLSVLLEEHGQAHRHYRAARERQSRLLATGLSLGIGVQATWTRADLHDA